MATQAGVGAESVVVNVGANQVPEPVKPAAAAGAAGSSAKWKWIIGITAVVVALGIGLGVGLGVGLKDKGEKVYTNIALDGTPGRTYFVAADTVLWDYAPSNKNMCYDDEYAANMTDSQFTRIGGKFYKAQYRQYTDSSFKTLAPRSDAHKHLGVLGPILYAEVGDVIRVVFKNNLDFAVNMVPYGLTLWQKEWASNNAVLRNSALNRVEPGQTVIYLWQVPPEAGPTNDQYAQSSRLWLYRSNVDPMRHDNAGLVGPVIVTAKGNAQPDGRAKDIDREFVAVYLNTFEAKSPYANVNLLNPIPGAETEGANNYKMSINGYIWCNQPGLDMNVGERVRWHIASVGSIDAMHNFHWHGHTVMLQGHHMDQFSAIADATISADMIPDSAGTWMFHCHVNQHMDSGMVSLYNVRGTSQVEALPGATRNYYIQAEMIEWDYAGPNRKNMCGCQNLTECEGEDIGDDENVFLGGPNNGTNGEPVLIGSLYYKAMYVEYTDDTFTEKVDRAGLLGETYTGLVGPIIRAEVGDRIRIVLRNNVSFPITLHPHGVQYAKDSEGTRYEDGTSGNDKLDDYVLPGQRHTYTWNVRERSGPGPQDGSSIVWMYHSHAHETKDSYSGLVGAIIVNRKGAGPAEGLMPNRAAQASDVDEEIVVYYSVIDELSTHYIQQNIARAIGPEFATDDNFARLAEDPGFMEHNLMHAINGYMYCNMPFLNFEAGKLVRVHFIMLGTLEDLHTPNMGGPHFNFLGSSVDSMIMAAGGMVSADAVFTQDGTYELNCQVADHVASGMRAKYSVVPGNVTITPTGRTRTYYISADTVDWDYAPGGVKKCTDKDFSQNGRDYAVQSKLHIGGKYVKAQYREYTDASFTTLKEVPSYYGIMGPIITAEVGDRITVVFRNNLETRGEEIDDGVLDVNLMLGGSLIGYDGYNNAAGFVVMPGQNFTYQWIVPDESAPSKADFNSVVYAYTSTTDTVGWPSTGLVGMLHIVAKGQLDQTTMRPMGVDQVVPMYWMTMDENLSPWIGLSARNAGINPDTLLGTEVTDFENTNQKRAVNGKIFCNLDPVKMKSGTTVRWLQMAYGTEGGVHSVNFPGQKFRVDRRAAYTNPSLMPSIARVMDMSPGQPGTFPYFCGVHDHFEAGMMASMDITA